MTRAGLQVANVVDFTAYRARRNRAEIAGHAAPSGMTLTILPMMIPVIAWIPVWQFAPIPPPEGQNQ